MASGRDFVVREKDFGVEVTDKNGRVQYVEKATFAIELLKHVDAAENGFILCRVYCSLREQERHENALPMSFCLFMHIL